MAGVAAPTLSAPGSLRVWHGARGDRARLAVEGQGLFSNLVKLCRLVPPRKIQKLRGTANCGTNSEANKNHFRREKIRINADKP